MLDSNEHLTVHRESLLKGKDQYSWPPCNQISCFYYWMYIFFLCKTNYLNEEVNWQSLLLQSGFLAESNTNFNRWRLCVKKRCHRHWCEYIWP